MCIRDSHTPLTFKYYSDYYVTHTKSNAQRDLAEGKIARRFMHDYEMVSQLAKTTCVLNMEIRQLQRWILDALPDTASQYLFPSPGKLVTTAGEGLLVHECAKVRKYSIHWNMSRGDKCFTSFPVTSAELNTTHFLELR